MAHAADEARTFAFSPTPAVVQSRARSRYVDCPVCRVDNSSYLFHKVGVRFVRCRTCGLVYVNPVSVEGAKNYLDMDAMELENPRDRELIAESFNAFLERLEAEFSKVVGRGPTRVVLLGKFSRAFEELPAARRMGLALAEIDDATFARLRSSDVEWVRELLEQPPDIVILHELLEACGDPGAALAQIVDLVPKETWFVATYTNAESLPARLMRRYYRPFFDVKTAFFTTGNVAALMARHGLVLASQFPFPVKHTMSYVASRVAPGTAIESVTRALPLATVETPVRAGNRAAVFHPSERVVEGREKLSIVLPVFNEARYVEQVVEALLAKQLKIDKELIIVESNSTDGTREIVRKFEGRAGVKVIYEERPRGKGHAVRTGFKAVSGTIVLIQDADFEYDIDDYDALLEPILQHRATFVLGSRSLGLDDWKVRRFAKGKARAFVLNAAQLLFARTYNVLYQQRVTDVNTMFKVFRAECLEGLDLESNGFELDIELACKLARNGNAPLEVPVNYVARGFDEGKKISFIRDSFPSYFAFLRYRFK